MTTRVIEVFTAGCPRCDATLELVRDAVADCGCQVVEHRCSPTEACAPAERYGVTVRPTIVADGRIVFEGRDGQPAREQLRELLGV